MWQKTSLNYLRGIGNRPISAVPSLQVWGHNKEDLHLDEGAWMDSAEHGLATLRGKGGGKGCQPRTWCLRRAASRLRLPRNRRERARRRRTWCESL